MSWSWQYWEANCQSEKCCNLCHEHPSFFYLCDENQHILQGLSQMPFFHEIFFWFSYQTWSILTFSVTCSVQLFLLFVSCSLPTLVILGASNNTSFTKRRCSVNMCRIQLVWRHFKYNRRPSIQCDCYKYFLVNQKKVGADPRELWAAPLLPMAWLPSQHGRSCSCPGAAQAASHWWHLPVGTRKS